MQAHAPIYLQLERAPNLLHISNVDDAPEFDLETINVRKLDDERVRANYEAAFKETIISTIRENIDNANDRYHALTSLIMANAHETLGIHKRTLNKKPKRIQRTLSERLASYCHTILLSKQ